MRWFGLVISALAAYRATRIFTRDSITDPWRDRLFEWAWDDSSGQTQPRNALRTYVYELLTCPMCLGVWFAAGAYVTYRYWDNTVTRGVLYVLAIAGLQCIAARGDP